MTFNPSKWYVFCDEHKKKAESNNLKGDFSPHTDQVPFKCEWNRDFEKKAHCNKPATWEFNPR